MILRRLFSACLGLALGLGFYLAYRSDYTLSNRLVRHLCGSANFVHFQQELRHWLPVPLLLRGSLPSALWCFVVTSLVGGWKVSVDGRIIVQLVWLAPLFNACWEFIQWIGWTDGHADLMDVVAGLVGWFVARHIFIRSTKPVEEIPDFKDWRVAVVVAGIACMGFADVWK